MDKNSVVLDISSDEDVGFNWPATEGCDSDIDWTELFVNLESGASNSPKRDDGYDSDDVVVIGEVFAKPKRTKKSSGVDKLAAPEEDDDDCVVLEGDPDKPVDEVKDSGCDSDELVIVSEKGQVACRDYPHSRHLCVKFPFGSTLHSDHCNLCHCYVCDSPAPCGKWGNGNTVTDHCHATDKEELWKSERKRTKHGGTAPDPDPIVSTAAETSFWRDLLGQIPTHVLPLAQNSGSNGYITGQAPSYDPPNIIRGQRTSGLPGRIKYCSNQPASQQTINPCRNNLQKARVPTYNPHSATFSPNLKRPRPIGRAGASVPAYKQARSNNSLSVFKHSYTNHLMGIRLSSKQTDTRQLHTGHFNGVVNSDPLQNSSAVNLSQVSAAGPMLSQGQAQLYCQPTAPTNGNPSVHPNGNPNEQISAPVTSNVHYNTSQQSVFFTGASDLQGGEQLPLTEEQPWNGANPDLRNWGLLENQGLNELPLLDAEDGVYSDGLWNF